MSPSRETAPLLPHTSTGLSSRMLANNSNPSPLRERLGRVFGPFTAVFRFIFGLWSWMEEKLLQFDNPVLNVLVHTLNCSPVNILLPVVVASLAICMLGNPSAGLKFGLNFVAIIPLAAILSFATEELADKLGPTWGGLANATFGNTVEAIVSIVALKNGQIEIVQQSMLGSILSNLLFVLGCCFYFSGIGVTERTFDATEAGNMYSLMLCACTAMVLPTVLAAVMNTGSGSDADALSGDTLKKVLTQSRASAVVMILLYVIFIYYRLTSTKEAKIVEAIVEEGIAEYSPEVDGADSVNTYGYYEPEPILPYQDAQEEEEEVSLSIVASVTVLAVATVIISVLADYLVESIDGVVESGIFSKMFIGLILIPIVGNAAEHVSSCVVAVKGKMDLAVEIALGSSIQIALLVTPLLVIIGAIISEPMTLHFQLFGSIALIFSVVLVGSLVQDGKSNALEGLMCLGIYALISISCWVYPDEVSAGAASIASIVSSGL